MPATLTSIIVDDEPDAINALIQMLHNTSPEVSVLAGANNAQTALEQVIDKHPDLIFLDIQMPVHDGFWLADKLRHMHNRPEIIFTTAYDAYAIEAIKHAAFDFLLKPIVPEELNQTLERYRSVNHQKENLNLKLEKLSDYLNKDRIRLNTLDGFRIVKPDEIVYINAEGSYSIIHLTDGREELISMHLGHVEEKLGSNNFLRIGRSLTINLDFLDSFNRKTKTVTLQDTLQKYELKASRSWAKALMHI